MTFSFSKTLAVTLALALVASVALGVTAFAQVDLNVNGSATSDTETSTDSANGTTSSEGSANVNLSSDAGVVLGDSGAASVTITQREAARASIDAESATLSASSVVSGEDLSLYVTSKLKRDASLQRIDASGDRVQVSYRQDARFLSFLPASVTTQATVTADGDIDVDYPWYRFLFSVDNSNDLEARIEAQVGDLIARVSAVGEASFDATTEAELIDRLYLVLSSSATSEVGT